MYFLQISDTHFLKDYQTNPDPFHEAFLNLTSPLEKLARIKEELQEEFPEMSLSFLLHCGDVTHAGEVEDASIVKTTLETLFPQVPIIATAGNHDHSSVVQKVFYQEEGTLFAHDRQVGELRILSFDNTNQRYQSGEINQTMAEWLLEKLEEQPEQDTILMCHHHCQASQHTMPSATLDPLFEEVMKQPQIKGFFTGHTHTPHLGQWGTVPYYTVSSLSFQAFPSDVKKDGYNVLDIYDTGAYHLFSFQNQKLTLEKEGKLPFDAVVGQAFMPQK